MSEPGPGGRDPVMAEQENPFSEPEDDDKTVIISREALTALAARRVAQQTPDSDADARLAPVDSGDFASLRQNGDSAVVGNAGALLSLVARLRNMIGAPDPGALRERAVLELRRYEAALREAKTPSEHVRLGHYVLCISLDDVVQCTPWGSRGPWAESSLTSAFHKDVHGGERFFDILAKLLETPSRYLPLIELMYICMSLGMHGKYRLSPRGPAELDRVREETYATIRRLRGTAAQDLSPHWQGLAAPFRPLRFEIPIWLASLIGLGLLALAYVLLVLSLAGQSDRVFAAADMLPPGRMPGLVRAAPALPTRAPESPGLRSRLLASLAADITDGRVTVDGSEFVPVLRLQSEDMFATGQAKIKAGSLPLLRRIASTIGHEGGTVQVVGYTDSQPIRTIAFPSNYDLSRARARAAAQVIGQSVDPAKISVIGRGAQDPRGNNATEAGRRSNRRVEIVVQSTDAQL